MFWEEQRRKLRALMAKGKKKNEKKNEKEKKMNRLMGFVAVEDNW